MNDQVTELQALNTSLTNEVRMLRAQLNAAKTVMRVGLIERPMSLLMAADGSACEDLVKLYARMELLENDAWTQTGSMAKDFVKAVKGLESDSDQSLGALVSFVDEWADKFRTLVGD